MDPAAAIEPTREGVLLRLHVQPGAKRSRLAGLHGDALKVQVAAPPVQGKANAALLRLLAALLEVRVNDLELVSGQGSRRKRVRCRGLDAAAAAARLARPSSP